MVKTNFHPHFRRTKNPQAALADLGEVIPTRSCQKFSKQICLWDLVQVIGILFIIQIVEAI